MYCIVSVLDDPICNFGQDCGKRYIFITTQHSNVMINITASNIGNLMLMPLDTSFDKDFLT